MYIIALILILIFYHYRMKSVSFCIIFADDFNGTPCLNPLSHHFIITSQ